MNAVTLEDAKLNLEELVEQVIAERGQPPRGPPDPVGERRAIEMDTLPLVNLRLAIERQVIGIFGDEHMGHSRLGR